MNICIVKESLNIGGTERSVANTSKILQHNNNVFLSLYDGRDIKYPYGGQLIDFDLPPKPTLSGKIINTFLRNRKLKKVISRYNVDILYLFTGIINRQTKYKYKNVVKIISARDFGGMRDKHNEYHNALLNSNAMICNSEYIKCFYTAIYPEHTDRVFTVYNYIDVNEIQEQAQESTEHDFSRFLSAHSSTVVSVGRFCKEKGFEYLIEAIALARNENNNLGFVLVGDGEYRGKYREVIDKYNLQDHVYFTGFQKNPYKYMVACSCFVLSSLSEGFPNVLAEAMALGLPVIAANCLSGPAEILRKDKNYDAVSEHFEECDYGLMTPRMTEENNENAISQLGAAIQKLLSDKNMMQRYAVLSRQRVSDFSEDTIRKQLNEILVELVERGKTK